jgi:hypothetical protein
MLLHGTFLHPLHHEMMGLVEPLDFFDRRLMVGSPNFLVLFLVATVTGPLGWWVVKLANDLEDITSLL